MIQTYDNHTTYKIQALLYRVEYLLTKNDLCTINIYELEGTRRV